MVYVVVHQSRGSTSYGEEFANLIIRAIRDDFDDLNSGVDA